MRLEERVSAPAIVVAPSLATLKISEPAAFKNLRKFPANEVVEEATIRSPVVEVAFTWKYELLEMEAVVVAPT